MAGAWLDVHLSQMEAVHNDPASDLTGFGQLVGRWKDKSGFANDSLQQSQWNRPTMATQGGGVNHLATQAGSMAAAAGGGSTSAFYMVHACSPVGDYCTLYNDRGAPNTGIKVAFNLGSGGFQVEVGNGTATDTLLVPCMKAKCVLEVWYQNGTLQARTDTSAVASMVVPMISPGTNGYHVGGDSLVYHHAHTKNHVPSDALRTGMVGHAKSEAGLQNVAPPPAGALAIAYPFGARLSPYVAGIKPNNVTNGAMDTAVKGHYELWKAKQVKPAGYIVAGGYIVDCEQTDTLAVSESMGYGMIITVLMAGHDPAAKTIFDGLLAVVRARPAYNLGGTASKLMDWRLAKNFGSRVEGVWGPPANDPGGVWVQQFNPDGTPKLVTVVDHRANGEGAGGGYNAFDGDEDIAMALLMAHKQWGSTGRWNYLQEGIETIGYMKTYNMLPNGATIGMPRRTDSRTSDYMVGHFKAYFRATGDAFWNLAVDKCYATLNRCQTVFAPNTGLMPDFVINVHTDTPAPSPGFVADRNYNEGFYYYNACRNPWRLATDYVTTGDNRFSTICNKLNAFLERDAGGNPENMNVAWKLDGTPLGTHRDHAFVGPALAGAMCGTQFQTWLNALWQWNRETPAYGYYGNELQLIPMIVASGNWWNP